MWIKLEDGRLTTTLYGKETDRNSFLLASSSHPSALKNGLPKSQIYRLRRICHSFEEFKENAIDMKQRFLARGYPTKSTEEAYNIALSTPRPHLLKKSVKKDKKFYVSCITTFTPRSFIIKNTIMKYLHLISDDPSLQDKFRDPPLFVSRLGPNLRNKVIEQIKLPRGGNIDKVLFQRELYWIHTLDALHPKGLNVDFDMSVML
ncbi:uncharacterized protein LOC122134886 [Cyprinus carpio]|uniref:Uncharacterized protein LOC122134886 n=1 Tax=Cyprinus carpio TaxID=7962 RepID=A0A9Q9VMR8_CYPCA|nr:uncharacterized protein LOC122134886 [Cyprinus carpio]